MNKMIKKMMALVMLVTTVVTTTGCSWIKSNNNVSNPSAETNNIINEESPKLSIADLKAKYSALGVNSNYSFRPFYNVEPTTEFTFHFNSDVDPVKAVTVHTDSKCEEPSTVYQINDGYKAKQGVDVVVKPREAVLRANDRNDYGTSGVWGYAPIYYLAIRYDLDSTTVKELDTPIVIPFTIKNKVSTPNAYASIDENNIFSIKWLPVEGATSYKIYSTRQHNNNGGELLKYTREELAFAGDGTLKLLNTVGSDIQQYIPSSIESSAQSLSNDGNVNKSSSGYVSAQNVNYTGVYYITAVDADGNESFFSRAVAFYPYTNTLPYKIISSDWGFAEGKNYLSELPSTIAVTAIDGTSKINYPVNFYRIASDDEVEQKLAYNNGAYIAYRYEVIGTKLTGTINYLSEKKEYPLEIISSVQLKGGLLEASHPEVIPNVEKETFSEAEYDDVKIDFTSKTTYPEEAKIKLDSAALIKRADIESARYINGGLYSTPLDSISTYVADGNPEYIAINENGRITVIKNNETTITTESQTEKLEELTEIRVKNQAEKTIQETSEQEEINNNNAVNENRRKTEEKAKKADKETINGTNYPIVANTAAQEYLALALINHEQKIVLNAFPELLDNENLLDDLFYVWYQNPYIMTWDYKNTKIIEDNKKGEAFITVSYGVDKETTKQYQKAVYDKTKNVVSQIIKPEMTETQKVEAIYNYLEKNARYNNEAYAYATSSSNNSADLYKKYANSWNTYGILCEGLGVCQSYAYAFNVLARESGLDSVMVVGFMNEGRTCLECC